MYKCTTVKKYLYVIGIKRICLILTFTVYIGFIEKIIIILLKCFMKNSKEK